jgi:hypothetical protein
MKNITTLTALSAAFLITAAIGSARAEDGDMTQTQMHDRIQTHLNLQASDTDFAQSLNREQNRSMNQNQSQNQYQYKYTSDASVERGGAGERSGMARSMDRYNTMDRYTQNSAMSGSMNRQNTATRSMGGGRR